VGRSVEMGKEGQVEGDGRRMGEKGYDGEIGEKMGKVMRKELGEKRWGKGNRKWRREEVARAQMREGA
jgi:hypothetical protein